MTDLNDKDFIARLNAHLANGGVIAFPTDTIWGLGALPTPAGVDALFEIKHRPHEKHFVIMSDTLEHLRPHMPDFSPLAVELAQRYLPGALTIVGNDDPIFGGVRIPDNADFRALCGVIDGHCLATTSANVSGAPVCETREEVEKIFPDIIIVGNGKPAGMASTVIKVIGDEVKILRQGSVVI
ncbi:MAG: Sua5/YciO/YrdC/YwlC family protein [Proteobacteria bacterium]|nr:Sua5/YciO/YrdC/YwlC family protein [Pseudomonadota bacterium]